MIAATVLGSLALVAIGIVPHSMLSVTMSETELPNAAHDSTKFQLGEKLT